MQRAGVAGSPQTLCVSRLIAETSDGSLELQNIFRHWTQLVSNMRQYSGIVFFWGDKCTKMEQCGESEGCLTTWGVGDPGYVRVGGWGGKRPGDLAGQDYWKSVRSHRTACCLSQGVLLT